MSIEDKSSSIGSGYRANRDVGNLLPLPGVFPDYPALVARTPTTAAS